MNDDAIEEMARIAVEVNERTEEIGARRLHTVMERVLDDLSFDASEREDGAFKVTAEYVNEQSKYNCRGSGSEQVHFIRQHDLQLKNLLSCLGNCLLNGKRKAKMLA